MGLARNTENEIHINVEFRPNPQEARVLVVDGGHEAAGTARVVRANLLGANAAGQPDEAKDDEGHGEAESHEGPSFHTLTCIRRNTRRRRTRCRLVSCKIPGRTMARGEILSRST